MRRAAFLAACVLAGASSAALGACGDVDAQPIGGASAEGGTPDGGPGRDASDASDEPDGSDAPAPPGDASSFCTGQGPIPLGNGQCTGDVAHLFRFAACACDSLAVSGQLQTSAVDGGSTAASIAANGQVATNAQATVGGSVWAAGQSLASGEPAVSMMSPSGTTSTVALDVQSGGGVTTSGTVLVGGSLYANGSVTVQSGSLSVVGTVTVPGGDSANGVTSGGGVVNASVEVPPPCDCSNVVDVASIVSAHASSNDDSPGTVSVGSLDNPSSQVLIPCGLFYVDAIQGTSSPISIEVTGRAALFVGGDLDAEDGITIIVDSGASLDLFVAENVTLKGATLLNKSGTAASMRMYVGGSALTLAAAATVNANLYAPAADVQLASNFTMSGAFFAGSLQFSGDFTIDYDVSILQTPGCTPPGTPCTSCDQCAGATPACKAGTCTTCSTNADCCPPLLCDAPSGTCVPPLQ